MAGRFALENDLELLRTMMGRTVVLRGRQKPDVVPGVPAFHERRVEPPPSDLRAYMAANAVPAILPP